MDLPCLPGYKPYTPKPASFAKRQIFSRAAGVQVERPRSAYRGRASTAAPRSRARPQSAVTRPATSSLSSSTIGHWTGRPRSALHAARPRTALAALGDGAPSWIRHDRQVLRFFLYFKEAVHESASESFRVRKCELFYYLEDKSIHIGEPKVQNSGIPQGVFVKRTPGRGVLKDDGISVWQPTDFTIGTEFTMYARTFRVVDCDSRTRAHLAAEHGVDAGEPEGYPEDPYTAMRRPKPRAHIESIRGAKKADTLKQFIENDRKVLAFDALWDDTASLYGEKRKYKLLYFLSDDSVQVREEHEKNSGRDRFPLLLRRQKLPTADGSGYCQADALKTGETVHVFGRELLLTQADAFTKNWFRTNLGVEQEDCPVASDTKAVPKMAVPPPTGFGSEADSLASFYNLVPKPPKKNFHKIQENYQKILRFSAGLNTDSAIDASRKFVISYYLADDTVSIFEQRQRNSGILGGKFLERGLFKKPTKTGMVNYQPNDFFIGATVSFNRFTFNIDAADGYTLKYMEGKPREFPLSNISLIHGKLIAALTSARNSGTLRGIFESYDSSGDGSLTYSDFKALLGRFNLYPEELTEQEVLTLMRKYDADLSGAIDYNELLRTINIGSPTAAQCRDEAKRMQSVEELILKKIRTDKRSMREAFRSIDTDNNLAISRAEFRTLLNGRMNLDLSDSEVSYLMRRYDGDGSGLIDYNEFCDVVYASDFVSELDGKQAARKHDALNPTRRVSVAGESLASYGKRAEEEDARQQHEDDLTAVMDVFTEKFFNKQYELRKNFRKLDINKTGKINEEDFIEALERTNNQLSDSDKFLLASKFFPDADTQLDFATFMQTMYQHGASRSGLAAHAELGSLVGH